MNCPKCGKPMKHFSKSGKRRCMACGFEKEWVA